MLLKAQERSFLRGKVTSNQDPNGMGRVQVVFPGFSGGAEQIATDWIRVVQPYASAGNGAWFIPDVGDEVVVAFVGGGFRDPLVIGTLYGNQRNPPTVGRKGDKNQDGENCLKFIRSRAGNQLVLDDTAGKEGVELSDSSGGSLKIEQGKIAIGKGDVEILDLLNQFLDVLSRNASAFVTTPDGPGTLNPAILTKVQELKMKLTSIQGKL